MFAGPAAAAVESVRTAVFHFELFDTSLVGEKIGSEGDQDRLNQVTEQMRALLAKDGVHTLVDTGPVADAARASRFRTCDGCDVDLARKLGAQASVVGWVQKVSPLILNINVQIRDVADGRLTQGGSVDIRGDTDESWRRGLKYLFVNVLFPEPEPK